MHGNAMQWVQDCLSDTYDEMPADGSAYQRDVALHLFDPAFEPLDG